MLTTGWSPLPEMRDVMRAVASVGSRGDSYDKALAETAHGQYKTDLPRLGGL